jgi:site-specific recombinase XerD
MQQNRMTRKKVYAQPVSVHDLLTIKDDLRGNLKRFLLECDNNNRSSATIKFYSQFIGYFLDFLNEYSVTQAEQILPEHVMAYNSQLKERNWKDVSIATSYKAIRRFCSWLAETERIDENKDPCRKLHAPAFKRKVIRPFSEEEIKGLFLIIDNRPMEGHTVHEREVCNLRDRAIIYIYLDTAVRLRELSEILLSDIDLNRNTIKVMGKNRDERTVAFSPKTKIALTKYIVYRGELRYDDLHLLVNEYGRPFTYSGICSLFRRLKKLAGFKSGVRCSSHTFRHTSAINCLRNGMESFTLQVMLGHKTLHQTICNDIIYCAQHIFRIYWE